MLWDRVACVYDIIANVINRKANRALTVCRTLSAGRERISSMNLHPDPTSAFSRTQAIPM